MEKWGVEFPNQSPEMKARHINTSLKRYGVSHPQKTSEQQGRIKATNLTKYGVETVGESIRVAPVPLAIPVHEPEYHFQYAPTPKLPPVKPRVVGEPLHNNDGDDKAELAGVESVQTETVTLAQPVVLQVLSALIE